MIFVGKNIRIMLKMMTAIQRILIPCWPFRLETYDWLVACYGIHGILTRSLDPWQLYCGIGVVDMGPWEKGVPR